MPKKKKQQQRDKDGKFTRKKNLSDEVADWFRRENDRTQTEGIREWEHSSENKKKTN